jgi:hypothetical protein
MVGARVRDEHRALVTRPLSSRPIPVPAPPIASASPLRASLSFRFAKREGAGLDDDRPQLGNAAAIMVIEVLQAHAAEAAPLERTTALPRSGCDACGADNR